MLHAVGPTDHFLTESPEETGAHRTANRAALIQTQFIPAFKDGRPVKSRILLSISYAAAGKKAVNRYMDGLSNEHDEDARGGAPVWQHFGHGLADAGAFGGFNHAGSNGASHGAANLRTLQGLEEGLHRLRG